MQICFDTRSRETYDYALMSGALPPSLDLAHAARRPFDLEARLPVKSMPRLVAALASDAGEAQISLQAGRDAGGQVLVTGDIEAELELQCQRCLAPVKLKVHTEPRLAWVKSDAALAALSEEYEPLLSADGRVMLADLVADELLLALPLVPRHEDGAACGGPAQGVAKADPAPDEDRKKPFAELAKLKRGR